MSRIQLPSMSLAKRAKESQEKRDAELIEKHGSTDPLRLEKRRRMASNSVKDLKEFVLRLQTEKRAMMAQAETEKKSLEEFFNSNQFKTLPDDQKQAVTQQATNNERSRAAEILHMDILVKQFNAQADVIDATTLLFDALTVRMIKTKKSGTKGYYRHTIALSMWDIGTMLDALCTKHMPDQYPESEKKDGGWEPEIDDEDILSDDDEEEDKKAKK